MMIDSTTLKMIGLLQTKLNEEPPDPDHEHFTGPELELVARHKLAWERNVDALRLLIGVRLTNMALEQYR